MLYCRRPGPAFSAPSRDRQPAEVRLIWGCDSKDPGIIFLLLSQGNLTLSKLHGQAYIIQSQDGDTVAPEGTARAETQGPASVAGRGGGAHRHSSTSPTSSKCSTCLCGNGPGRSEIGTFMMLPH